jgi:hypothetical protein
VNNDNTVIPNSPGGTGGSGSGGGGDSDVPPEGETPPGPGVPNPGDPVAQPPVPEICGATGPDGSPLPGDELEVCAGTCENPKSEWYLCPPEIIFTDGASCEKIEPSLAGKLLVTPDMTGKKLWLIGSCPDPGSPDGYGEPNTSSPTPTVGEPPVPPIFCPGGSDSGGQGSFSRLVNVGEGLGSFSFSYQAFGIPDSFTISGAASFSSGVVSGSGTVSVQKTSTSPWITVSVQAPLSGTAWNYSVGCTS